MFIKYLSNFPLDAVQSGALLAVFVSFFYFTGAALVSVLTKADNMRPENTADFFLPNTAVGIILFGTLFFIAGSTAGVNAGNLLGMFAASTLVSAVIMKGAGVRLFGIISDTNSGQAAIFIKLSILAILSVSLVKALAPPTGNDAMAYHLLHPMQYLDAHKIYDIQTDRESLWPYLTEMLYTAGLYVKGFSLAKLFHWMFFPLCLASVYRIAKDIHSEESAWMAVLFSALIPVVFNQSGVAYVDLSLAFYFLVPQIMLAYSVSAKRDYSILIGVLLGGLLAIKYLGIGACASIVLAWWIVARMRLKSILTISLWVIAVSGFWYVRSWLLRGNPVYPFFYEAFNGNGFPLTLRDSYEIGSGFYDYLITPFRMTAFPNLYGGDVVGPICLALTPLLFLYVPKKKYEQALLLSSLFYGTFVFFQSQNIRFWIPSILCIAPILSVRAYEYYRQSRYKKYLVTLVCLMTFLHLSMYFFKAIEPLKVVLGWESPVMYLQKKDRSFNPNAYLNSVVEKQDSILNMGEPRRIYGPYDQMVVMNAKLRHELELKGITLEEYVRSQSFVWIWVAEENVSKIKANLDDSYLLQKSFRYKERDTVYISHMYKRSEKVNR